MYPVCAGERGCFAATLARSCSVSFRTQLRSVRDLLYRVDNRSVAIDDVCNDSVAESGLFRHAARAFRQGFELVYVNKFYACLTQSVMQFRVFGFTATPF